MKLRAQYYPTVERSRTNKFEFFVKFKYVMFPELADEFPGAFKHETVVPMNYDYDEEENMFFEVEVERPYGKIEDKVICYRSKGVSEDDPSAELKELNDAASLKQITWDIEPHPISAEEQKERDLQEENENREREQKARETQIKLEEEKARLRAEQQQIIMK